MLKGQREMAHLRSCEEVGGDVGRTYTVISESIVTLGIARATQNSTPNLISTQKEM